MLTITVTKGAGEGLTPIAAFDSALRDAGIANYNLVYLSSVIPERSVIECRKFLAPSDEYGDRLYVVIARCDAAENGKEAWAGLGWVQDEDSGRGFFVEHHATTKTEVETGILKSIESLRANRLEAYAPLHSTICGVASHGNPVCALVVAIFKSEGW